ncbi:hypothetical protein [Pseudomonas phage GP100]|nr:hypothetical protein [Pseudomonas phage GP100]
METKLVQFEEFRDEDVFLEPGSHYIDCSFWKCRLIWYEGFPNDPAWIERSRLYGCFTMSFSEYLEATNKPVEIHGGECGVLRHFKPQAAIPWYVNQGKKW